MVLTHNTTKECMVIIVHYIGRLEKNFESEIYSCMSTEVQNFDDEY